MTGKIKDLLEYIIAQRANGNATIAATTKAKIFLKGINIDRYTEISEDDPVVMEKVRQIAVEFGLHLSN